MAEDGVSSSKSNRKFFSGNALCNFELEAKGRKEAVALEVEAVALAADLTFCFS